MQKKNRDRYVFPKKTPLYPLGYYPEFCIAFHRLICSLVGLGATATENNRDGYRLSYGPILPIWGALKD
jgi:hypothetical protein